MRYATGKSRAKSSGSTTGTDSLVPDDPDNVDGKRSAQPRSCSLTWVHKANTTLSQQFEKEEPLLS